jgi:hypothetical protein
MSKSQSPSPSQPSTSLPAIPDHLLPVFELVSSLSSIECWRIGAPILLDLGIIEPTTFRKAEPDQIGEMFRERIQPTEQWFKRAEDLGRYINDHKLVTVALMRIAAVELVGS